jgi:hypothetical protein
VPNVGQFPRSCAVRLWRKVRCHSLGAAIVWCAAFTVLGGGFRLALPAFSGTVVLRVTRELPALTIVTSKDFEVVRVANPPNNALVEESPVLGRTTTVKLARGTVLTDTAVRSVPPQWWLMTVPLSNTPPPEIGDSVVLVGVGPVWMPTFSFENALVESIGENQIVVAVPDAIAKQAANYMGVGRQLLVFRVGEGSDYQRGRLDHEQHVLMLQGRSAD